MRRITAGVAEAPYYLPDRRLPKPIVQAANNKGRRAPRRATARRRILAAVVATTVALGLLTPTFPAAASPQASSPALASPAATAPTGTWTIAQEVGHGAVPGSLNSVSCPTEDNCIAVGTEMGVKRATAPLVETLTGSTWVATTLPLPSGSSAASLRGLACLSIAWCEAVGVETSSGADHPLAETMSGETWSVTSPALPAGASTGGLKSVACTGAKTCVAVGYSGAPKAPWIVSLADGTWTTSTASSTSLGVTGELNGISCFDIKYCVAAGYEASSVPTTLKALLMTGHPGSVTGQPGFWALGPTDINGTGLAASGLNSVACPRPGACIAVGELGVILAQSGTKWTKVPGEGSPWLLGVSCLVPGKCTAVGAHSGSNTEGSDDSVATDPQGVVIEGPSTTGWASVQPTISPSTQSVIKSLACRPHGVFFVGTTWTGTFSAYTLILQYSPGTVASAEQSVSRIVPTITGTPC
jgi:hypothetical protein